MVRRTSGQPQDPSAREFYEVARCGLCGQEARVVAMDAHQASDRCGVQRIQREMRERDWSLIPDSVGSSWAIGIFERIGIPWDSALSGTGRGGKDAEYGFWAPTWACALAHVVRHMDMFRLEARFRRVSDRPELQDAVASAFLLAKEADADPVAAVVAVLRADAPELYRAAE